MLNVVTLMGRATMDAELRRTGSGLAVASFTLACERDFANSEGEKGTDFIDIVAWRNTAEFAAKHVTKGRMFAVTGRLQIRTWTDKEGNKRRNAEVVADNIYFADSKPKEPQSGYPAPAPAYQKHDDDAPNPLGELPVEPVGDDEYDHLPF